MVAPLLLAGGVALGSMGLSAAYSQYQNNKYARSLQDKYYKEQLSAYRSLWRGMEDFHKKQGLSIDPDRAWTSYFGNVKALENNINQNLIGSNNLDYGMVQTGAGYGQGLYRNFGKLYNRL